MSVSALYGPPKVGGDTLSWCTKCKMELAHVIASMVTGRPAKVICKTCGSQHKYRSGSPDLAPRASSSSRPKLPKASERSIVKVSELWEKKMSEKSSVPPKAYKVSDTFLAGDVIQHTQFGLGIVQEARTNGKISVLFRNEEKILVHGLQRTA